MGPNILRGTIDAFKKRKDPNVHRPLLNGNKRKADTKKRKRTRKRPGDDERKRQLIGDNGEDTARNKISELLQRHVSDETELKSGDILRYGMLLHTKNIVEGK